MARALGRLALNVGLQQALASVSARLGRPLHKPHKVSFEIVETCNLSCLHCDIWKDRPSPGALALEEWSAHLRELRRWIGPFALGFQSGEPLLSPLLLPLVREASSLGVLSGAVTNGVLLDERWAGALADAGLSTLSVSLDGLRPETHDRGRGVPGTHARALAGARLARRRGGAVVKLNTLVAGHNLDELAGLARLARDEGLAGVSFQALRRVGSRWAELWPEPARAARALDELLRLREQGLPVLNPPAQLRAMRRYFEAPDEGFPGELCGTFAHWEVRANGEVRTCTHKPAIGNVRAASPASIWASAAARERFGEVLACAKDCLLLNCHFRPGLGARAAQLLGHVRAGAN